MAVLNPKRSRPLVLNNLASNLGAIYVAQATPTNLDTSPTYQMIDKLSTANIEAANLPANRYSPQLMLTTFQVNGNKIQLNWNKNDKFTYPMAFIREGVAARAIVLCGLGTTSDPDKTSTTEVKGYISINIASNPAPQFMAISGIEIEML